MSNKKFIAIVTTLVMLIGIIGYNAWDRMFRFKKIDLLSIENDIDGLQLDLIQFDRRYEYFKDNLSGAKSSERFALANKCFDLQLEVQKMADDIEKGKDKLPKKYHDTVDDFVAAIGWFKKDLGKIESGLAEWDTEMINNYWLDDMKNTYDNTWHWYDKLKINYDKFFDKYGTYFDD